MDVYTAVILITLIAAYILEFVSDLLDMKTLKREIPEEFRDVYDAETYRKSQIYIGEKTRFGLLCRTFDLLVLLAFWFWGGFEKLDRLVRAPGWSEIPTGLAYTGILIFAKTLLSLPFRAYATFAIEERFGFNKTTARVFAADVAKGLVLTALLGGILLAGVLAFFLHAGPLAWLYAWAGITLFMLFIQYVAPRWIMPWFNKFEPLGEGELKDRITAYAASARFPLQGIYVIDGSRRSSKSNAFFTGIGKHKRIALYDTLIAGHTTPELVGILAHEIGHFQKKHVLCNMAIGICQTGAMLFLLSIFLRHGGLFDAFFVEIPSVYAGLIFFGLLFAPIDLALSVVFQALSRRFEFAADRFAAETMDDRQALIDGLKKLMKNNLSHLMPHPFSVFLYHSHPPVLQRIRAIAGIKPSETPENAE